MKQKYIDLYMDWALRLATLSHARRLNVGAVIVKDDTVISYGYNGTPAGWDNNCEDKVFWNPELEPLEESEVESLYPFVAISDEGGSYIGRYRLKTKSEVLHAERNALDKLAKRGGVGGKDAAIFITHSPCIECAKSIYGAGIKEVYYNEDYGSAEGIQFLENCGIKVKKTTRQ